MSWERWRADNLAGWEDRVPIHLGPGGYDVDALLADPRRLSKTVRHDADALGSLAGLEVVHLQCHLGTDTLSWARHGARVSGLDFSPKSIEAARTLASDCGIDARFYCADVYDAVEAVGGRRFDIVYTGIGALGWLPDLQLWAQVVAGLLRTGGVLYLVEIHPLVIGMMHDGRTLDLDVFEADFVRWDDKGGTYAAPDAVMENTVTYERAHSLSDVITAVLDAGLTLELFHEQSYTNAPWPWTERGDDGYYRLPAGRPRFPLTYSLRARAGDLA